MAELPTSEGEPASNRAGASHLADLARIVEVSCQLLPAQGPITAFVFLNTLMGLEHLPFEEGLRQGARLFGCEPYYTEARYRAELERGRIRLQDIEEVLMEDLAERLDGLVGSLGTRFHLRRRMLEHALPTATGDELEWLISETDALSQFRADVPVTERRRLTDETRRWLMRQRSARAGENGDLGHERQAELLSELLAPFRAAEPDDWSAEQWEGYTLQTLWRICLFGASRVPPPRRRKLRVERHRDLLYGVVGQDSDSLVHDLLVRFCAAYADQGLARWALPDRDQGFFECFIGLYGHSGGPRARWLRGLASELQQLDRAHVTPLQSLAESLEELGIPGVEWEEVIPASLLSLRGWAGMLWQMEVRADRVARATPKGTAVEFLAVQFLLERFALAHIARGTLGYRGPLKNLRQELYARLPRHSAESELRERAFELFQLAQLAGWSPQTLMNMTDGEWVSLIREIDDFSDFERRRILHRAYERGYRRTALDAVASHVQRPVERPASPTFQAVFCIDTREESFRRHLEEVEPSVETFGAAGFFGIPIYFRGAADAQFAALCPIVIRPEHYVVEDVVYSLEQSHRRRARTRRALGATTQRVHLGTRGLATGALLTAGLGVLATAPLVLRVVFPRLAARMRRTATEFLAPPPVTRLRLERTAPKPGVDDDGIGFSVEEMARAAERLLRDIGLTSGFARLVLFLGHGSFCLNNPHKSAYDCGACSGSAGGPNARALASFLNERRVREMLAARGVVIPADTWFVGGQHNTCNDTISFLDLDLLPRDHHKEFELAVEILEKACERNAHERCRRFLSAPLDISPAAALRHVEERSQDLAQTRPEFGNASNAMCFVGRRARTRHLYMDRRSFLVSYDPMLDDESSSILGRILSAVVPVCSGINLQYFFSSIDSPGWGCGTKLPHNITSLLGVMDGASSDLRSGLPWQGVEIHEPLRCLFVIETRRQSMLRLMESNPVVGRILHNGWSQLTVLEPETSELYVYRDKQFMRYHPERVDLPRAASSHDWYRGWRDHLGFAIIHS